MPTAAGRRTWSTAASSRSRTRGRPTARIAPSSARAFSAAARRTTPASSSRAPRPTTTSGALAGRTPSSSRTCDAPNASFERDVAGIDEISPWHAAFARPPGDDAILHPLNAVGPVRWNAAFAYLDPARGRPNLTIMADTLVDRVAPRRRPRNGRGHLRRRAPGGSGHAGRGRLRLARDPAAQRHRPGDAACPSGKA